MKESYSKRLERAAEIISRAERVAIGGGAGLSAAAGLNYSGVRFTENFADFIKKYGLKDMYSATFYPYSAQDKKTAFIEAGVGYNTPSVIKYPFERFTYLNPNARLIRINTGEPQTPPEISERTVLFTEDAKEVIKDIGAAL